MITAVGASGAPNSVKACVAGGFLTGRIDQNNLMPERVSTTPSREARTTSCDRHRFFKKSSVVASRVTFRPARRPVNLTLTD